MKERERLSKSVICLQFRDNGLRQITVIGDSSARRGRRRLSTEAFDCSF